MRTTPLPSADRRLPRMRVSRCALLVIRCSFVRVPPGPSWCEGCGRSVGRAGFPSGSFGEDYPLSAVDKFTCRVEVTGVACCLSDHLRGDPARSAGPPAAKQVFGPPGGWAVKGRGGNDGVGKLYLPPVGVQHRGGRQVRRNLPCVIRLVVWHRLASDDSPEPKPADVDRPKGDQPGAAPRR